LHPTSGALTGLGAVVTGAASVSQITNASGVLFGPGAIIVGAAGRTATHASSGALVGLGATIAGTSGGSSLYPDPSVVEEGVIYGPDGMYTGTLTPTTDKSIIGLRSFTGRF
jgi:hypothetical protein